MVCPYQLPMFWALNDWRSVHALYRAKNGIFYLQWMTNPASLTELAE